MPQLVDTPSLSIIVAVYNAFHTIGRCIESVTAQTYPYRELIVIDGGSTDGTVEILRQKSDQIQYWVSEPDTGICNAWNKGVQKARGEWIGFLGADDFLWSGILAGLGTLEAKAIYGPGDPLEHTSGADAGKLQPWLDVGEKLVLQLKAWGIVDDPDLCFLSHSHMLQGGTFAVVCGARFKTWASISGPVRDDMQRARRIARDGVERWVQFADPAVLSDRTIVEGEWFGGGGPVPQFDLPEGTTVTTPGSGHSGLLEDPDLRAKYGLWDVFTRAA